MPEEDLVSCLCITHRRVSLLRRAVQCFLNQTWAARELVVLHEIAHHLAEPSEAPSHGPEFVDRMLTLTAEVVGEEAAFLLRVTLLDCGVRIG